MAIGALAFTASASAVGFVPGGTIKQAGTLTYELGGGSQYVCSGFSMTGIGGTLWFAWDNTNGQQCSVGGWREVPSTAGAGFKVTIGSGPGASYSPYGGLYRVNSDAPFINGNASTPSRIVLNDTVLGIDGATGQTVTASGTLDVTTPTGGLVILQ